MTIFRILFLFQNIIHIDRYQSDTYPSLPLKYVENLFRKNTRFWIKKENFAMLPYCGSVNMGLNGKCFFSEQTLYHHRWYKKRDDKFDNFTNMEHYNLYTIISHSDFLDQNFIHEQFLMEVAAAAVPLQINHHHNKCEILGKSWWKCSSKLYTQFWEIDSTLFLIILPTYI